MIKLWSICRITFMQTIRQPIYGVLLLLGLLVLVLTLPTAGFTMGAGGSDYQETDQMMLMQMGLGTMLLMGLFLAAFSASSALSREIEDKTVLTVVSKPVSRATFVLGKFGGVTAAVMLAFYLASIVFLLTVRHKVQTTVNDPADMPVIVLGLTGFALAVLAAVAGNIFFGWHFVSSTVIGMVVSLTLAMGIVTFVGKDWKLVPAGYDVAPHSFPGMVLVQLDRYERMEGFREFVESHGYRTEKAEPYRRLITVVHPSDKSFEQAVRELEAQPGVVDAGIAADPPAITRQLLVAMLLMLLAVVTLCAVAVAASTRLGQVLTLVVVLAVAVIGSMYAWFFGEQSNQVVMVWVLGLLVPKLNYFYAIDALSMETYIPPGYLGEAALYGGLYVIGALALGIALFYRRSLEAEGGSASMPGPVGLLAWTGRLAAIALGALGIEAIASITVAQLVDSFDPLVYNALAGIVTSPPSHIAAIGLSVVLLLTAGGLWLLWGFFSRGSRWAWWTAVAIVATPAGYMLVRLLSPAASGLPQAVQTNRLVLGLIITLVILAAMVLPSTRRHFAAKK